MSKIQTALSKLQGGKAPKADDPAPLAPDARRKRNAASLDVQVGLVSHNYQGRQVIVDLSMLVSQGMRPPEGQVQQIADEYRSIKRPLLKNADSKEPVVPRGNLWMVTSSLAGEGKTFSSINLALSIASERDRSVVLVDLDCGKSHISRLFDAIDEPGFMDLLQDTSLSFDALVMPTDIPGLSLLPVGKRDNHASEHLSSDRMQELCESISAADPNRIVLFDSSPLLLTAEAPVLASEVGQVILVVRANKTPRQAVLDAYHRLDTSIPANLILTHAAARESVNAYGGYYGYGASEKLPD
jgi:exopolysaccharide/PEP-CTERM locus tyrosine autokinase